LASPHLPDDLPSPDESHRSTKTHLPSIPQGKELIIPVNGPPCYIRQTEIVVADLSSLTTSNYSHDLPDSNSLEIKEQITMVVESTKGPSGSPKHSHAAKAISNDKTLSTTAFLTSSESSSCSNTTTTATNSPSSLKVVPKPIKGRQRCLSESVATPVVHHKTNISPKSHKFFGRLRLFSLSGDRSRSSNSTTEAMDESGSTPISPGFELTPPHLMPKAKNCTSQRLEFSGKPILNNSKFLPKQRPRRSCLSV
uniref:C2 domain-containing protein n=1 Tax=Rodentolepis nana TaxID=102285 RepID=A0A158QIB2_RODNA